MPQTQSKQDRRQCLAWLLAEMVGVAAAAGGRCAGACGPGVDYAQNNTYGYGNSMTDRNNVAVSLRRTF